MPWTRRLAPLLVALATLLLPGCSKKAMYADEMYPMEEDYGGDGYGYADVNSDSVEVAMAEATSTRSSRSQAKRSAAPSAPPPPPVAAMDAPAPEPDAPADAPASSARMVHYDGSARLRVARVRDAQDALTAVAASVGGLVERQYGNAIVLRVPVATFDATFERVLAVGEVLDKRITATDVTDAFTATELRLKTARTTRDRMVELLAKAEDEKDKLFLVREIQRLTEEIDRLEGQSRTLSSLASMSRISAELVPRGAITWRDAGDDAAELRSIRALSPFRMDVARSGRKLALQVPDGLVDLREKGHWVVQSADGARVWSGDLDNRPLGDAAFWLAALEERLGPEFATATPGTLGGLSTLRLVSRDDDPYVWIIGVQVVGRRLHLVEQFYPSLEHEQRHAPQVQAALATPGGVL